MNVLGYVRVSTDEQGRSGLGIEAQRARIEAEADRRGWTVEWITDDGYSAKDLRRPGIAGALDRLDAGEAEALVVAKLDRLSRSVVDFAGLLERSRREEWDLVALDLGVDTTTPTGAFVANLMANVAQLERELIGQRTSDALQALKRRGVRLGGPVQTPDEIRQRIADERDAGASLRTIADGLNADGIPTAQGGARWYASTVQAVLRSLELDAEAEAAAAESRDSTEVAA